MTVEDFGSTPHDPYNVPPFRQSRFERRVEAATIPVLVPPCQLEQYSAWTATIETPRFARGRSIHALQTAVELRIATQAPVHEDRSMTNTSTDDGVIAALLERFQTIRLPRALDIKTRVDNGERLHENDIAFLNRVLEDAQHIQPLLDRHPEYEELVTRAMHLYSEITRKALQNEQGG